MNQGNVPTAAQWNNEYGQTANSRTICNELTASCNRQVHQIHQYAPSVSLVCQLPHAIMPQQRNVIHLDFADEIQASSEILHVFDLRHTCGMKKWK